MTIDIKPKYLEDRVIFNCHIGQCHGVLDEDETYEIAKDKIMLLPLLPENPGRVEVKTFEVPGVNGSVAFIIHGWVENGACESMFELNGPYYKPEYHDQRKLYKLKNKSFTSSQL